MVLNQFAADIRQKVRPVKRISVGNKVDSAKNGTFLVTYATVELLAVLVELYADPARGKAFLGTGGNNTGFRVNKMEFRQFVEVVHFGDHKFQKPGCHNAFALVVVQFVGVVNDFAKGHFAIVQHQHRLFAGVGGACLGRARCFLLAFFALRAFVQHRFHPPVGQVFFPGDGFFLRHL